MKFEKSEKAIFLISGLVISALIIIPAYAVDTIILVNEGGGTPESCVAGGGLILAQNLTDLCDVVIITPLNNQIIQYNGTYWVNANATTSDDTLCANVGTGAQVYKDAECNFRTIVGSADISVVQNLNEIVIDFNGTAGGDTTACTNVGAGTGLICRGGNVDIKSLIQGSGITITNNANDITIANASPESSVCNNVGTGNQLCSGGNINMDTLIAGTGITITDTTDDWTFASQCANTGTGEAVCESSNNINSLIAGSGITITDTTGDLTISATGGLSDPTTINTLNIDQDLNIRGDITPSQITSDQNDYNPSGLANATILRLSTDARRIITGLAGGSDGRIIVIENIGSFVIRLTSEDTASSAGNRFSFGIEQWLYPDDSIVLIYDSTDSRWRSTTDSNTLVISKPADETVNNSAVLQDDNDFSFAVATNAIYQIDHFVIHMDMKASSDIKYAFTVPASATIIGITGTNNYQYPNTSVSAIGDLTATRIMTTTSSNIFLVSPMSALIDTAGTGGTVQFQWAQNSAVSEDTSLLIGSYMIVKRLM